MNIKSLFKWTYKKASDYNLFMLEENDYDENDNPNDAAIAFEHQKYKTRLYVVLLMSKYNFISPFDL